LQLSNLDRAAHIATDFIGPEAFQLLVGKSKQLALGEKCTRLGTFSL